MLSLPFSNPLAFNPITCPKTVHSTLLLGSVHISPVTCLALPHPHPHNLSSEGGVKKPAKQEDDNFTIFITLVKGNEFCFHLLLCCVIWFWSPTSPLFVGSGSSVGVAHQRRHGNNKQNCPDNQMRQLRYLRTPHFVFIFSSFLKNLSPLSSKWSPEELGREVYISKHCKKKKKTFVYVSSLFLFCSAL